MTHICLSIPRFMSSIHTENPPSAQYWPFSCNLAFARLVLRDRGPTRARRRSQAEQETVKTGASYSPKRKYQYGRTNRRSSLQSRSTRNSLFGVVEELHTPHCQHARCVQHVEPPPLTPKLGRNRGGKRTKLSQQHREGAVRTREWISVCVFPAQSRLEFASTV